MDDNTFISGQSYEPLRRLISDKKIQEIQSQIRIKSSGEQTKWNEVTIPFNEFNPSNWQT